MTGVEPRFVPLSRAPVAPVIDFLAAWDVPADIARWKYFDDRFNRDRGERGMVILRGQRVVGFLGLTRFAYGAGERTWQCAWLTDWFKSEDAGKGAGRRLLDECLRTCHITAAVGGSPVSRYLFPKLAVHMAPSAYLALRVPLRLGAALDLVGRHLGRALRSRVPAALWGPAADLGARIEALAGALPVARAPARPATRAVTEPGVARAIEPLLRAGPGVPMGARSDLGYIDWLLGRCPAVEAGTTYVSDHSGVQAAVVFWRRRPAGRTWRMALFARGAGSALAAAVDHAVAHVHEAGAVAASVLVSRLDRARIDLLRRRNFWVGRSRVPFWLFRHPGATEPVREWARLGYLDADLAYRF